jgi:Uma2 family endonuclease
MDFPTPQPKISIERYLLEEEQADYRSEYHDGEIFAMGGGSARHNHLCNRMGHLLEQSLESRDCLVFNSDMKVAVEAFNSFLYPDLTVVCGNLSYFQERDDIICNPLLLVEVLSESTQAFDWGGKFMKYRSLPSFREYVLVHTQKPRVDVFSQLDEKVWQMRTYEDPEDQVTLASLEITFSLEALYKKWQAL